MPVKNFRFQEVYRIEILDSENEIITDSDDILKLKECPFSLKKTLRFWKNKKKTLVFGKDHSEGSMK